MAPAPARAHAVAGGRSTPRAGISLLTTLTWGLIWATVGALVMYYLAPNPWPIQPARAIEMQASLSVLNHGGPALLGYATHTHAPYAIGYADDQGIYVVVPLLSHWLGQANPTATLRWLWLLAWTSTLLFSAPVFRSLFRSSWAALIAPPTLLVCILSFGFGDIYWVTAWIAVTFMPLLLLLLRCRARHMWLALVAIALVAGVVTSIRSDAGLPVALATAACAWLAGGRRAIRVAVIVLVAMSYLAPTAIVLPAIRANRDHRIGVDLSANESTSHPLWHSLYIGLGYTSNRFGIHYLDSDADAAAQELEPGVRFLSPAYATALHKQVDALVSRYPGFVAKAEAEKLVVELFLAGPYLVLLALLLPSALATRGPARLRWSELALFMPALVIGAVPAIVAIPLRDYELTLLGPLGALGLLTIGSAAAQAQARWPAGLARTSGWAGRARLLRRELSSCLPRRSTLRALLVAVVILAPTVVLARHFEAEHARWDAGERNNPVVVLAAADTTGTSAHG